MQLPPEWHTVDSPIGVSELVVDVWDAELDLPTDEVESLERLLSRTERDRASRFRFEHHRRRFIAARGRLRQLTGCYVNASPETIVIETRESGKPFTRGRQSIEFNIAHCDNRAVLAFATRPIGVDLERIRPLSDLLPLAARFFAPGEYGLLRQLSGASLEETFFRCWTLKEAYLKACGDGLAVPLSAFEVSLDPRDPRLLFHEADPLEPSRWQFGAWTEGPFAIALAVATNNPAMVIRRRSWPSGCLGRQ